MTINTTWEQRINEWITKEYAGKEFQEDTPVILTEKGERVRSKSEKIMADYFYRNGIEYKYECPLYLKGMGIVYPDFTFLSKKTGITYETEQTILNTGKIEQLVNKYL